MTTQCDQDGKCTCKPNITGDKCDQSDPGYYNFPDPKGKSLFSVLGEFVYFLNFPRKFRVFSFQFFILPSECECNPDGSMDQNCDDTTGKCTCKEHIVGDKCDQCASGFFGYPQCQACECSEDGALDNSCNENGVCSCKAHVTGDKCDACVTGFLGFPGCDQCNDDFHGYPNCEACDCNTEGSVSTACTDGKCECKPNIVGDKCDQVEPGYYDFPDPKDCQCDAEGSVATTCDNR